MYAQSKLLGEWLAMETRQETIQVKGGSAESITLRETIFGPVVSEHALDRKPREEAALLVGSGKLFVGRFFERGDGVNAPRPLPAPTPELPRTGRDLGFAPAIEQGLREISAADRRFDLLTFLEGAKAAYGMVLEAFWRDFKPKAGEVMEQKPSDITAALELPGDPAARSFARAGYRTVAFKPAVTRPWPEGAGLGFEGDGGVGPGGGHAEQEGVRAGERSEGHEDRERHRGSGREGRPAPPHSRQRRRRSPRRFRR